MGRSSYDGPTSLSWATYRDGRWLVKDGPVPGLGEEGATLRSETPVLCSNATADDPFVSMMFAVTRVGPQGPQVVAIAAQVYHPGSKASHAAVGMLAAEVARCLGCSLLGPLAAWVAGCLGRLLLGSLAAWAELAGRRCDEVYN